MKREELDKLREKYFDGNTSLEEERLLKKKEKDEFFGTLKEPAENMDWDFDSFLEKTKEVEEKLVSTKVVPLKRKIVFFTSVAASLLLGFFFIQQWMIRNTVKIEPDNAYEQIEKNKSVGNSIKEEIPQPNPEEMISKVKMEEDHKLVQVASVKKVAKKRPVVETVESDEGLYVEINGVRIYDEEKALEVTETALHLATTNLRKGMEGVENIKYLKIEI